MRWNGFFTCTLLLASLSIPALAQHGAGTEGPIHFRVFDAAGNPSSLDAVVETALRADVVMVGEEHNDPIAHWLQAELLKRLIDESGDRPVALSLEMFERDVQHVVDEYLQGHISETHFKKSGRAWSNYDTDYRPMVETARKAGIPVIAANAPRRYVNRVSREGAGSLGELSSQARAWLSPLPYEGASEEYAAQWNAMMAEQMAEMESARDDEEQDEEMAGACRCGGTQKKMHRHRGMGTADSSASGMKGMHGKMSMGAGHGMKMMGSDSSGTAGHMCPHCRAMHGDSTGAGIRGGMKGMHGKSSGGGHGRKMMMHRDSTGAGLQQCPGCRHGMGSKASEGGQKAAPGAMPDDEIHRSLQPDSDDESEESAAMMPGADAGGMHAAMAGMLDAQALWDATMAHSIATLLEKEPEAVVMHAVGGFHVEHGTGIPEHLAEYRPSAKQLVIAIRSADDIQAFDEDDSGRGDFVILTDASLPRSYETRTD